MRSVVAMGAVVVALGAGCGGSTSSPGGTVVRSGGPSPHHDPTYLVWVVYNDVTDGEEARRRSPQTFRVRAADDGHAVVEALPGVVLAYGGRLYRWSEQRVPVPLYDCEDLADESSVSREPVGEGSATRALIEPLSGGEPIEIVPAPQPDDVNELQHHVTLLGTVGPYLFVRSDTSHYSCGAHGGVTSSFLLWDLRSRSAVEPFSPAELSAQQRDERPRALAALAAEGQDQLDEDLAPGDVEISAVAPTLGLDGFGLRLLFSAPACYACGDGIWSSYTRSVWVEARGLPELLAPHAEVPAPVLSFIRQLSDDDPRAQAGGFTTP